MARLLSLLTLDGPAHMALDEALLETAPATTLRLYRWRPPAVSLGYFQLYAPIASALPRPMPIVRRITGGGAIWHEHELTYALVGELGRDGLPARTRDCYGLLHGAVRAALVRRGCTLGLQEATVGDRRYREEPRCFASPAACDLVANAGGKVLGSAARARGGRVLIHGSLKLATNEWDGPAAAACGIEEEAAAAALVEGIGAALGCPFEPGELGDDERAAWRRIRAARYDDEAWVRHRAGPRA